MAAMTVRLVDRFISLDVGDPAERFARPAPPPSRFWFVNPLAWAALLAIAGYQRLVPARHKPACRFTPSCSTYVSLSIRKYGLWRGGRRGLHRLRRCTGFVPGGEDAP
jgi:putative membrane protein insertion efficiency factor